MEMALELKRRQNQSRGSNQLMHQLDDDMQIMYVCKICKATFEDHQLDAFKEHKKEHLMNGEAQAQSTPIKEEFENKATRANLYQCRQCTQTFRTYMSRLNHETQSHPKTDKNETFPGAKKSSKRLRGHRRSPLVKHSEPKSEQQTPKVYACDSCDKTFPNHKAKFWHDVKVHKLNFGKSTKKKPQTTATCRYCDKTFEKSYSKYNHERVCTQKPQIQMQNHGDDSSEVIEQPLPVNPIVELTEEEGSPVAEDTQNDEIIKCARCSEEFSSGRARSLHEKNIHNLQVNECRVCGKTFASYATRYQHEKKCKLNNSMTEEQESVNGKDDNGEFHVALVHTLS